MSHSKVLSRLSIGYILSEESKPGITRNLDSERTQIVGDNCCHTLWISLQAKASFPLYSTLEYQEKEAYACTSLWISIVKYVFSESLSVGSKQTSDKT